eukprot:scaffold20156_cov43-Phaeocystis_antarctica.AAC.1
MEPWPEARGGSSTCVLVAGARRVGLTDPARRCGPDRGQLFANSEEVVHGKRGLDDAGAVLVGRAQHLGFTLAGEVRPQARRALERLVRAAVAAAVHERPREPTTVSPRQVAALDELPWRGGADGWHWGRLDASIGDVGDDAALEEGLLAARQRRHLHNRDARVTTEELRAR